MVINRIFWPSLLFATLAGCGPAKDMPEFYTEQINPVSYRSELEVFDEKDQKVFYLLPLSGSVTKEKILWSGYDWAANEGGINLRWNSPEGSWQYTNSPGWFEALLMTTEQLKILSPSEKYDLLMGQYQYPFKEFVATTPLENLRKGWILASLHHKEPSPKELRSNEGIKVPFGSSDIKALLSLYYAHLYVPMDLKELGSHREMDAGTFHAILGNLIGLKGSSFLMGDLPVKSYASRIEDELPPAPGDPLGTVKTLKIRARLVLIGPTMENTWENVLGTPLQKTLTKDFVYYLYLNLDNEILKGKWLGPERPQRIWIASKNKEFLPPLEHLGKLLDD